MRHLNTILILLLLCSFPKIYSQKIFVTEIKSEASYIVYISESKYDADWIIKKTKWENQAKDGIWFFTKWKHEADIIIYIAKEKYEAKKIVYYTEWDKEIKFQNRNNGK